MLKNSIVIKGIAVSAHCGVSEGERAIKQPLLVDIRFSCPNQSAFLSDRLSDTVDYGAVVRRVREIAEGKAFSLVETLTEQICRSLLAEFPITRLHVWVRKTQPPLEGVQGSVGIQAVHTRQGGQSDESREFDASRFLVNQLPNLPRGNALDVAAGRGRHSLFLASRGFSVHAIDRDEQALNALQSHAQLAGLSSISTQTVNLEKHPTSPPDLGTYTYDLILVFFYLYRPLFPRLIQALKPGGMIVYETFLIDNHVRYHHPRRKEFCLKHNELLRLLPGLRILYYEEGSHVDRPHEEPSITARILAHKPLETC